MGGGKSGGAGTTYDYYGTIACGVCIGPVDALVSIILDGQEVWPQGTPWTVGLAIVAGNLYVYDAQTWVCTTNHTASQANAPGSGLEGWTEYTFARGSAAYNDFSITTSDGTYYGVLRFYWGTAAQTVDPNLEAANNDAGQTHPPYAGVCYIVLINFLLGQEIQSAPNVEVVVRKAPTQSVVTGGPAGLTDGQANPAAVVADILTNENCIGLPAAALDATSFNAVATACDSNPTLYGISALIDANETLRSVLEKITNTLDGFVRFNPATGLIEMGIYQHGVTPGSYVTLTEDDLTEVPKLKSTSWQGTYSRATVRYPDRQINYQTTSLHADDPRAWTVLKSVREMNLDRPYICRQTQALNHGHETLRVIGHAQLTGTLKVRREFARNCKAGGYVLLDVDIEPNNFTVYQFFRITKRTIPMTGPMTLDIMADNTLAAIPWPSASAPVFAATSTVPAITNFRILEVPTILSGSKGAIIALCQRPSALVIGCQIFFDTSTGGTFPLLGAFTGFAAKGVLQANVAAGDGTVSVTVDTTQVDAAYFTNSYSANDAANDTMLAFLVQVVPSGGDAGEVAESGGFQIMEICSVSTMTLVSAGQYTLTVLRGRQNTAPQAFTAAHSEVWLIPRANVSAFTNSLFDQIRANRIAGLTPAYAQFRLCPYTFEAQLPLASASNEQFHFPLNSASAPTLTLTAPASYAPTIAGVTSWPTIVQVTGTWSDPDGNLVELMVRLRKSTDTSDRVISDVTFAPCTSQALNSYVQIEQPGAYTLKLLARDATNLTTERDIIITVSGTGAAKCALPQFLDVNGVPILNDYEYLGSANDPGYYSGPVGSRTLHKADPTAITTGVPDWSGNYANYRGTGQYGVISCPAYPNGGGGWFWSIVSNQNIPFDSLQMLSSTPGATVYFVTTGLILLNGLLTRSNQAQIYVPGTCQPSNALTTGESYQIFAWATAPGFATSDLVVLYVAQAH